MTIERIPTKMERWFLDFCSKEQDRCIQEKNFPGQMFWYEILKRAHNEFYYRKSSKR